MTESDKKLLSALRRIFRPMVRALIGKSIPLPAVIDLLKQAYVESAADQLVAEGKKPTDSQISVMTGVHRKDVKEYRSRIDSNETATPRLSAGAELIAVWLGSDAYLDAEGKPLPLPYAPGKAGEKSFSSLAESISKDVRPRVLLDNLERLGIASEDKLTGIVTLRAEAFLPRENYDEKIHYLGQNSGDHLEAAVTNIFADKPPFLDRSVYHDQLSAESAEELRRLSIEAGMKLLRQVNRKAFELSEKDKGNPESRHRINLGVFFFSEREDSSEK